MNPRPQYELSSGLAVAAAGTGVILIVFGSALVYWPLGLIALGVCLLVLALFGIEPWLAGRYDRSHAVGVWYDDFSQTTDEEVRELLARAGAVPAS